jgi:hypothetical protein
LEALGIDTAILWGRIYDAIIKSFLSVEGVLNSTGKKGVSSKTQNCFELFGFDIMIDDDFMPWILEANLSPSLVCDTPLDYHIKANLIVDTMNLVGIKKYRRNKEAFGKKIKFQPSGQLQNSGAKPSKVQNKRAS